MPKKCEVAYCKEQGAHRFPKAKEVMKKWLKAIRRPNFKPEKNSKLCRLHFLDSDYQKTSFYTGLQNRHRYLKNNTVPSVFPWTTKTISKEAQAREERLRARNLRQSLFGGAQTAYSTDIETFEHHNVPDIATEECIATEVISENEVTVTAAKNKTIGTQTSSISRYFCTDLLLTDNASVLFYTGLESYSKFQMVLSTLLPMANSLKYRWSHVIGLSAEEQFCILLIKLRRNKPDFEIAKMFNVSKTLVSNIIFTWIHFTYDFWSMIDIWHSRDLVNYYMPQVFKEQSRVIIDGTEIPISKPSNPTSQRATFSTYKNTNTVKFLIGATPGGLTSYCSEASGGATSDRQMIERSSLLKTCEEGDSIMADRGFNVQDLFAAKNINVNVPTFLKGRSQLPGFILKRDQQLASQRVHIERLIGLTKTYKILQTPLDSYYVPLASQIFYICIMLCNFRKGIVKKNK